MEAFILVVQLYTGGPVVYMEVPDCKDASILWMKAARHWAMRSGVRIDDGPMLACGPRNLMLPLRPDQRQR